MKIFRIIGENNQWLLINLAAVVEINEEKKEIIFDGIFRIKMNDQEFSRVQNEIWGKMFDLL